MDAPLLQIRLIMLWLLVTISYRSIGQKVEYVLQNEGDTTQHYYITIHPDQPVKGVLLLLPGFAEMPATTILETDIHTYAAKAGYLTVIPALGDWSFFYIDDASHDKLNEFIESFYKKYSLDGKAFVLGGHSFGGTMAVQYAQRASLKGSALRAPSAVFAIDPPLDIERLYRCMTTTNRPEKHRVSVKEDTYVTSRIKTEFRTNPKDNPEYFWTVSPYAQSDTSHLSLQSVLALPIRIYNEPDIGWYIENRHVDYRCMNIIDSAAMINWLRALGNVRAELITTTGKGYRKRNNMRHPHSWSIADGKELVEWIETTLP